MAIIPSAGHGSASHVPGTHPATSHAPTATSGAAGHAGRADWAATAKPVDIASALAITPQDYAEGQQVLVNYANVQGRSIGSGQRAPNGSWNRGVLQVKQDRLGAGSLFTVYSGHNATQDSFRALTLRMRATPNGGYTQDRDLISFGGGQPVQTKHGPGNNQYESVLKYYVSDQELSNAISNVMPGTSVDAVLKSAQFAVHGNFASGHNWGNFDRHGIFQMKLASGPAPTPEPRIVVGLPPNQAKVELDISVPISDTRKAKFTALDTKEAAYVSHLEAEAKVRVPLTLFLELNRRVQDLANNPVPAEMQKIFANEAADWQVERVKKYDPKGVEMTPDKHGLLPVNPFHDIYLDNANRDLAKNFIALRMRSVAGEKNNFTQFNYKPGPGIRDNQTNVVRRLETEIIAKKEVSRNPSLMLPFFSDGNEALNPHNLGSQFVMSTTGRPLPAQVLGQPAADITQFSGIGSNRRYKFEVTNKKTLVAFEASLDLNTTLATDARGMPVRVDANGVVDPNGQYYAISTFGQAEPEANHMAGVVGGANTPHAPAPAAAPPLPAAPANGAATAGNTSLGPPATYIHSLNDLNSPVFKTDPGYVQFDKVMPAFQQWLFGGGKIGDRLGAMPTEQKNAIGQRLAGTVPMTAQEKQLYAQELEATRQFRLNASAILKPVVDAAEQEIAQAQHVFGGVGPRYEEAVAQAREKVWKAFSDLNPLDYVDLATLPPP
ncbi:MAG: CYTH domain-containing protein [Myxococcaceae bacterium]|nr:CYTH domain-containing protein [Myxococcaceae bacterium]